MNLLDQTIKWLFWVKKHLKLSQNIKRHIDILKCTILIWLNQVRILPINVSSMRCWPFRKRLPSVLYCSHGTLILFKFCCSQHCDGGRREIIIFSYLVTYCSYISISFDWFAYRTVYWMTFSIKHYTGSIFCNCLKPICKIKTR